MPYRIETHVAALLAHDLHFTGLGDNAVVAHQDWGLFGLEDADVRGELKKVSLQGHFIIQAAGDVIHIGWNYQSLQELIDVFVKR